MGERICVGRSLVRVYTPVVPAAGLLVQRDRELNEDSPPCRALDRRRARLFAGWLRRRRMQQSLRRLRDRFGRSLRVRSGARDARAQQALDALPEVAGMPGRDVAGLAAMVAGVATGSTRMTGLGLDIMADIVARISAPDEPERR